VSVDTHILYVYDTYVPMHQVLLVQLSMPYKLQDRTETSTGVEYFDPRGVAWTGPTDRPKTKKMSVGIPS
jgi:hypothetical protein